MKGTQDPLFQNLASSLDEDEVKEDTGGKE